MSTCLAGCRIKSIWLIFKTEMLICQLKANVDLKVLCDIITHHLYPEIRKMLVRSCTGT